MGLIYEYSKTDDYAYNYRAKPVIPAQEVPEQEDIPQQQGQEAAEPREPAALPWTGIDIALGAIIGVVTFFGLVMMVGFVAAFNFALTNPDVLETQDPYVTAQELVQPFEEQAVLRYLFTATVYAITLLASTLFVAFRAKWQWEALGLKRMSPSTLNYAVMMGGAGSLAMIGAALLVGGSAVMTEGLREALSESDPRVIGAAVVVGLTLLPLGSELFFRGVLFTFLRARSGLIYGSVISALAYGLFNPTPIGFFPSVAIGAAMALVYHRTGSLWGAYFAHSAFNCVTIGLYWFALQQL